VQVDLQVDFSKAGAWANLQTVSRIGSILLSAVDRPAVECAKKYLYYTCRFEPTWTADLGSIRTV